MSEYDDRNPPLPGQNPPPKELEVTEQGLVVGTSAVAANIRNADLTFAAGDCVGYVGAAGQTPPNMFEDLQNPPWNCLGWLDTSGYTFKNTENTKDINAAGTLSAIRTVITGGSKQFSFVALESMNPIVRALFDDVNMSQLIPAGSRTDAACGTTANSTTVTDAAITAADIGKTVVGAGILAGTYIESVIAGTSFVTNQAATTTGANVALQIGSNTLNYVLPTRPSGNQYSMIFDTLDGDRKVRVYAPQVMITTRGDDVYTQADVESLSMTATLYPGNIALPNQNPVQGVMARYVDYGASYTGGAFV